MKWRKWAGLAAALAALGLAVCAPRWAPAPPPMAWRAERLWLPVSRPEVPAGTVSVNRGSVLELTELPGVGETMAQAIVDERRSRGAFHFPEDLLSVRGIGPSRLAIFRDMLDLSGGVADDE